MNQLRCLLRSALVAAAFVGRLTLRVEAAPAHPPRPVVVAPFLVPADLSALGPELAQAAVATLRQATVEARVGLAKGADLSWSLNGKLEVLGEDRVRLAATCHGASAEAVGDVERVDELLREVIEKLRPGLASGPTTPAEPKKPVKQAQAPVKKDPIPKGLPEAKIKTKPEIKTETKPDTKADSKPEARPETKTDPKTEGKSEKPPGKDDTGLTPPLASDEPPRPVSPEQPAPEDTIPRVAVNVVGEPLVPPTSPLRGTGAPAQQALVGYLKRRLHVVGVPVPSVGLVDGREAAARSTAVRAHFTLMVRFDALNILPSASGGFGLLTLTGRIHVVLLRDGKLQIDRSFALPSTYFTQADPPGTIASRAVQAAMDSIHGELAAKLSAHP